MPNCKKVRPLIKRKSFNMIKTTNNRDNIIDRKQNSCYKIVQVVKGKHEQNQARNGIYKKKVIR